MQIKTSYIFLIAGTVALSSIFLSFQTQPTLLEPPTPTAVGDTLENSLLWEISGKGLKKPSYLFGTIHLISGDDFFLTDLMKRKFNQSEQLVLEIDMDDPSLMFSMMGNLTMKGGVTLKDLLTEAEYNQVKTHIEDKMQMPMFMFERMKPMFTSTMVAEGNISTGNMKSYEMVFIEMAKENDLKIQGLETVQYQLSIFDSIPYQEQAKMLVEAMNNTGGMGAETFDKMTAYYKAQNLNALYRVIVEEADEFGEYEDLLLVNRNKNWIPQIEKYAKEKTTFFAVGAGHLPGENGVINLLRQAGFTVKPLI